MTSDGPVVDEVRRRCAALSSRFGDDLQAYGRHLMEYQRQFADRPVSQTMAVVAEPDAPGPRSGIGE